MRGQKYVRGERRAALCATQTVHQLGHGRDDQVRVLVPLLLQRLRDAPDGRLLGLTALQHLLVVQHQEARVGDRLGRLLEGRRVAHPQPRHGALAEQADQLSERAAPLPLGDLRRLLGLLGGHILPVAVGPCAAPAAAPPAARAHGLGTFPAQQPLGGPAQEENADLAGGPRVAGRVEHFRLLLFARADGLLRLLGPRDLGAHTARGVGQQVDDAGPHAVVEAGPRLQERKDEREGLVLGERVPLRGQDLPDQAVQGGAHLPGRQVVHGRQVCRPQPVVAWLGEQLLGLEGQRKLPHRRPMEGRRPLQR
mmetsp:Transcript_105343/g.278221  ORF Transcript_105343/g.278221 Transcript_105343/m.278221 type:complete len:309 (-) Transcript_105343:59-985(-)